MKQNPALRAVLEKASINPFFNLLSSYPDLVATLKEANIAFEYLWGLEHHVYDRLHRLFPEVERPVITQVAQLVYIAGKDLNWLDVEDAFDEGQIHTTYTFSVPDDLIGTMILDKKEQLQKLFCYTQFKRFTERIPQKELPSVTCRSPNSYARKQSLTSM